MSSMTLQSNVWANLRFDYTLKFSDQRFYVIENIVTTGTGDVSSYSTRNAYLKFKFDFKLNSDIVYTYETVLYCPSTGLVPFSNYTIFNDTFSSAMFN